NVRGVRDRAMSECLREANTIGGEGVERGGFDLLVPVAANVIGAEGIDGDEVHVGGRLSRGGRLAGRSAGCLAPGRSSEQCDPDKDRDENGPHENGKPPQKRAAHHNLSAELRPLRSARERAFPAMTCDKLNSPMVPAFRRLILILTALTAFYAAAQTPAKPAPNVVLITVDTLRADHIGCYGYKQIKTPNIDSLAGDGAR